MKHQLEGLWMLTCLLDSFRNYESTKVCVEPARNTSADLTFFHLLVEIPVCGRQESCMCYKTWPFGKGFTSHPFSSSICKVGIARTQICSMSQLINILGRKSCSWGSECCSIVQRLHDSVELTSKGFLCLLGGLSAPSVPAEMLFTCTVIE